MDTALVTGADSGIGLQIARQLVELGYRVYGLAADFSACNWQHHDFMQVVCDLSRTDHLQQAWEHIAAHNPQVGVVVFARPSPELPNGFEAAAAEDIAHCVQSGLLAPLLLTRWALPSLVRFRGHVISIGWNGQGACRQGAVAAAIEGGLHHWSQGLFEELRDTGVKVCTVYPWRNAGAADAKARLKLEPQSEVDAKFVAKAVAQLLQSKENNLVTQIVVRPQGTREEPRIAPSVEPLLAGPKDIVLPDPDKRPPPPQPIPTPEPRRPDDAWEFDDEDDEDEWEEDDELDALLESSRRILREQNETARRQLQRTREKGTRDKGNRDKGSRENDNRQGRGDGRPSQGGERERSRNRDEGRKGQPQGEAKERGPRPNEGSSTRGDESKRTEAAEHANDSHHFADEASGNAAGSQGVADEAQRDAADSGEGKRRRRRRRGGRGRNRRPEGDYSGEGSVRSNAGGTHPGEGGAPKGGSEQRDRQQRERREVRPQQESKQQGSPAAERQSARGADNAAGRERAERGENRTASSAGREPLPQGRTAAGASMANTADANNAADAGKRAAGAEPSASVRKKTATRKSAAKTAAKKQANPAEGGASAAPSASPKISSAPSAGAAAVPTAKAASGGESSATAAVAVAKKTAVKKAAKKAATKKVATKKTATKKAAAKKTARKSAAGE